MQCTSLMAMHHLKIFSLRVFPQGFETRVRGTPMWSKGVLDYGSGVCCFKEVKTTAKILITLAF